MIKKNLWRAILSSLLILLPVGYGLLTWDSLPITDGKELLVFLPVLLLAIHWLCLVITALDQRRRPQSQKATRILFWIVPVLSLTVTITMYTLMSGKEAAIHRLFALLFGVLFIILGNVMPTVRQNRTFGIRIYTTLGNEENWNKTHRFSGKIWVIGGFAVLLTAWLPALWMAACAGVIVLVLLALPPIYSYRLYQQHRQEGITYTPLGSNKKAMSVSIFAVVAVLALVGVLTVTGDVEVTCGETSFTVDSIYCQTVEVAYEQIDSMEYRENYPTDQRLFGFGSPRLLLGTFQNEEFGTYSRYTYAGNRPGIILRLDGKVMVIGGRDAAKTQEIYNALLQHGAGR